MGLTALLGGVPTPHGMSGGGGGMGHQQVWGNTQHMDFIYTHLFAIIVVFHICTSHAPHILPSCYPSLQPKNYRGVRYHKERHQWQAYVLDDDQVSQCRRYEVPVGYDCQHCRLSQHI